MMCWWKEDEGWTNKVILILPATRKQWEIQEERD